ncbi:hypothetical protein LCGC14_2564660, partial [marine sediment metagenome]
MPSIVQGIALDSNGTALASPSVTVYEAGTTTAVTIYSDRAGATAKANPFTGDAAGRWAFYVATGRYDLVFVAGTTTYTLEDVEVQDLLTHASRHYAGGADPLDPDQIDVTTALSLIVGPASGIQAAIGNLESHLIDFESAFVDTLRNVESNIFLVAEQMFANRRFDDGVPQYFGTDGDFSFRFDGFDLVITAATTGSGISFDLADTSGTLIFDNKGSTGVTMIASGILDLDPQNLTFFGGKVTSGIGQVALLNAATPPTNIGINTVAFWAADILASSAFHIMDESEHVYAFGNATFYGSNTASGDLTLESSLNPLKGEILLKDPVGMVPHWESAFEDQLSNMESSIFHVAEQAFLRQPAFAKVGSFTRDTSLAAGSQVVTGVGFKPVGIIFFSGQQSTAEFSIGLDDGSTSLGWGDRHPITADIWFRLTSDAIIDFETSSFQYYGRISSFDADGFTISWT